MQNCKQMCSQAGSVVRVKIIVWTGDSMRFLSWEQIGDLIVEEMVLYLDIRSFRGELLGGEVRSIGKGI